MMVAILLDSYVPRVNHAKAREPYWDTTGSSAQRPPTMLRIFGSNVFELHVVGILPSNADKTSQQLDLYRLMLCHHPKYEQLANAWTRFEYEQHPLIPSLDVKTNF